MEKINFVNNQAPAISASSLNQLQTNVESAINGVVESGSNDNGYWVKYSDGTMECYGTKSYESTAFAATGNVYYRDLSGVTFPVPFKENEIIVPTCSMAMGNVGAITPISVSNTGISGFSVLSASSSARGITVYWRAIGKWK